MAGPTKAERAQPRPRPRVRVRVPLTRPIATSFLALNRTLPLRSIRSEAELAAALEVAEELVRREDLDEGEADYLDTLTDIIRKYESVAHPIPDASESDVLRVLMEGRGISQIALAEGTKISQSTVSAVLSGKRSLTKEQILTLARFFAVSPAVFLPTSSR